MLLASRLGAVVCSTAIKYAICNVLAHAALEASAHLKDCRRNAKVVMRLAKVWVTETNQTCVLRYQFFDPQHFVREELKSVAFVANCTWKSVKVAMPMSNKHPH